MTGSSFSVGSTQSAVHSQQSAIGCCREYPAGSLKTDIFIRILT